MALVPTCIGHFWLLLLLLNLLRLLLLFLFLVLVRNNFHAISIFSVIIERCLDLLSFLTSVNHLYLYFFLFFCLVLLNLFFDFFFFLRHNPVSLIFRWTLTASSPCVLRLYNRLIWITFALLLGGLLARAIRLHKVISICGLFLSSSRFVYRWVSLLQIFLFFTKALVLLIRDDNRLLVMSSFRLLILAIVWFNHSVFCLFFARLKSIFLFK